MLENCYRGGSFVLQTQRHNFNYDAHSRQDGQPRMSSGIADILPTFKPPVKGLSNAPCKPHDLKIWMTDANKSTAFPVHAMMTNKWGGGIIPLIINLRTI